MKILYLVRSLGYGGAERQLVQLAKALNERGQSIGVAEFYSGGPLGEDLSYSGVLLHSLEKRARWDLHAFLIRLVRLLRAEKPDILHAYLVVPHIVSILVKPFVPGLRVAWRIAASRLDLSRYDRLVRASNWAECKLSRFSDAIVVNSIAGRDHAIALGFDARRIEFIRNGIDLAAFHPDAAARSSVRQELAILEDTPLVGMVARWDPQKDHRNFVQAAGRLLRAIPYVHFLLCGEGVDRENRRLREWIDLEGLGNQAHLLGRRGDVARLMASMDIASLSSLDGEGSPNAVAEAMACAVPCVVTDVGDSALVVGETGRVVPPSDPQAMAEAWERLLRMGPAARAELGATARKRIQEHYSLPMMVSRYEALYREMLTS